MTQAISLTMLVSVMMTNFNHGHFLEARLASILEQLDGQSEVVIVDDASTDNSVSIIQKFIAKDSRIRLIQNGKNVGVVESVNLALRATKGQYIISLAADDKILPGFIEKTLKVLLEFPDIAICCSDCGLSFDGFPNKDPNQIETTRLLETDVNFHVFRPKELVKIFRTTNFWIPGHTAIIKREALMKRGGFDGRLEFLCDWFLLHAIALTEGVAYIPETLSIWRQHNKTYSAEIQSDEVRKKNVYRKLFLVLSEKKNQSIRKLFRKSTLLRFYLRQLIWELALDPRQWDLIAVIIMKAIRWRFCRYILRRKII